MSEDELDRLAEKIVKALDEKRWPPRQLHHDHHVFISELVERRRRRDQMMMKVKVALIGFFITTLGTLVMKFIEWVKQRGGHM